MCIYDFSPIMTINFILFEEKERGIIKWGTNSLIAQKTDCKKKLI